MPQKSQPNIPAASYGAYQFWKIASSWWFFPAFYVLLVLIFIGVIIGLEGGGIADISREAWAEFGAMFLWVFYFMPNGLFFFLAFAQNARWFEEIIFIFPGVFHAAWIVSLIIIQIFKHKRRTILKWLILAWIILMLLSFAGCTAMVYNESSIFGSGGFF